MESMIDFLTRHPIFAGLQETQMDRIIAAARPVQFHAGQKIFGEGDEATEFYLLRSGRVALEIPRPYYEGIFEVHQIGPGEVLGWSWFLEPYQWHFDARAREMTRAVAIDAQQLRALCQADPVLGFEFAKRFARLMLERLNATRFRLLELSRQGR